MSIQKQWAELSTKSRLAGVILLCGLCVPLYAVASTGVPALPPLPPFPSAPSAPSPTSTTAPQAPMANTPQAPALPSLPGLATLTPSPGAGKSDNKLLNPLADLPPPTPGSSDIAQPPAATLLPPPIVSANGGDVPAPPDLPNLPLPPPPVTTPTITQPFIPLPGQPLAETPAVEEKKPQQKTWLTRLAPAVIPPQTNFNYHRQILPRTISNISYSYDNQHLPLAVMREDYARLLFMSVARNDVESARAVLNTGTPMNITDTNGETPLMMANRIGARNVAALLVARGARL